MLAAPGSKVRISEAMHLSAIPIYLDDDEVSEDDSVDKSERNTVAVQNQRLLDAKKQMDHLGGREVTPAASDHGGSQNQAEVAKGSAENSSFSESISNFFFENVGVKFSWAGAYTAANIARTVENSLSAVHSTDSEVQLIISLVRAAVGLLLQCYDTGDAVRNEAKLEKKEDDSINLLETSHPKAQEAIQKAKKKKNSKNEISNGGASADTAESLEELVKAYSISSKAESSVEKYSSAARDAKVLTAMVKAKETFFTAGAAINLGRTVIESIRHFAPVLLAGGCAVGFAVATTVLAVIGVVVALAANIIDICQGCAKVIEAHKEAADFSARKKRFEGLTVVGGDLKNLSPSFRFGMSDLLDRKVGNARINTAYAVSRIVRGVVGLAISVLSGVALVVSVGSASVIAGIIGGATLTLYFGSIIAKISRDISQSLAEVEECNEAESLKKKYADVDIFEENQNGSSLTMDDADLDSNEKSAYKNRYFLIWMVAKQFDKDVIDNKDEAKVKRMDNLLHSIGLSEGDVDVLKLLPSQSKNRIKLVEETIRLRLGIVDRKPEEKGINKTVETNVKAEGIFDSSLQTHAV